MILYYFPWKFCRCHLWGTLGRQQGRLKGKIGDLGLAAGLAGGRPGNLGPAVGPTLCAWAWSKVLFHAPRQIFVLLRRVFLVATAFATDYLSIATDCFCRGRFASVRTGYFLLRHLDNSVPTEVLSRLLSTDIMPMFRCVALVLSVVTVVLSRLARKWLHVSTLSRATENCLSPSAC